ncbi:MAG: hypothetical protein ACI90V_003261 [Bacillariaceae sp.]|jgi:hypothetical protein
MICHVYWYQSFLRWLFESDFFFCSHFGSSGMIDSPGGNQNIMDRGYDFPGVVRWFASRADIVLVFFDPDKVRSYSIQTHKHTLFRNKIMFLRSRNSPFAQNLAWNYW